MPDVVLTGCRPEPLASYLKALGMLRLVAEQKDGEARGFWDGEAFVLRSVLDEDALRRFFQEEWRPTPVVAPWNGGSGFYPKDNRRALEAIVASTSARLEPYRTTIAVAAAYIAQRRWTERPEGEEKTALLSIMRARLPDAAVAWLDAAVVVGDSRLMFPPLLGTGGNDGRLDFSNNFMQRVVDVVDVADARLEAALFEAAVMVRYEGAMGQYLPAAHSRTNPWDFVLLIEGALLFAGTATRRFGTVAPGTMAFPFHARAAGGAATVAESDAEESRDELWLPLWTMPTTLRELRALLGEGRAKVGEADKVRAAGSGLDFARAISQLGVDRGITSFTRVGFHQRNGLTYYATPLGRLATGSVRSVRLLDELDSWLERFLRAARSDKVPASIRAVARRLEDAVFDLAAGASPAVVLLALGDAEASLAKRLAFVEAQYLTPVPRLSERWWEEVGAEHSTEGRLGSALRFREGLRSRILPLDERGGRFGRGDDPGAVFRDRALVENLHALLLRDDLDGREVVAGPVPYPCSLEDLAAFIDGAVDDARVERWARGLTILERPTRTSARPTLARADDRLPPASFALLALVQGRRLADDVVIPRASTMLARACAGDSSTATKAALDRLRACGLRVGIDALVETPARTRRIAAALAFPLTPQQRRALRHMLSPEPRPEHRTQETTHADP